MHPNVHSSITISPLHTNLQVANFQRQESVFACPITKLVLFEEALLAFEAQDLNVERYT